MNINKEMLLRPLTKYFLNFQSRNISGKAIVFSNYGNPSEVLQLHNYNIETNPLKPILVKFLASPINPSDINQIEGVYPEKPSFTKDLGTDFPCSVAGNEGVVEIIENMDKKSEFKPGKRAIMKNPGFGTWRTHAIADPNDLLFLDIDDVTAIQAATLSVNPCTAYCLLKNFYKLKPGDYFIQNGANSHVGQAAIQFGRIWGLNSINIIRNRSNIDKLKSFLYDLGATHVITDIELANKEFMEELVKKCCGESGIPLGLNCVGGKSILDLARYIKPNGHIVTYGAMSRQPLLMSSGILIFKNVHLHGFWITKYNRTYPEKRLKILNNILTYIKNKSFKDLLCDKVYLDKSLQDLIYMKTFKNALENKERKQVLVFN
ncbi:hypothetical protein PNEG_00340 [Pneumocystis murina B123]|uniref:enoyl-[acyl-carrier-protein] reductase n=1 Tax=Pneumocystis murina (strain B123) TaxID=1069680 RepID=M7NW18_PNEMU|nr:hypothetical protein PNEG_00340 [Pneumocystis murina B123]EMR11311.1 hypothetical protein PNEG_00340 [Pneumocystis murina B123]